MKLNFMMFFIALSFFTVLGIFAAEYYQNIVAMQNGLEQCIVEVSDNHYETIWSDACE